MPKTHIIIMKICHLMHVSHAISKENCCNYEFGFLHKNLINFLRVNFSNVLYKKVKEATLVFI